MACESGSGVGDIVKGFFDFLGDPIGTILAIIANKVLSGAISVFGDLVTNIPTLSSETAGEVNQQTQWIVVYAAVGSLIFAAGRMALERRGEAGGVALKGLMRVILVAGGATAVMTALANLSDRYADHLFATGAQQQLTAVGCGGSNNIQSVLLLVLALLLLVAAIVQTILMYVRLGVMIILLGTLPLAAAASMTNWGSGWWRKHIGWMIAWLLYKPAAGLVIFAGAAMISNGQDKSNGEAVHVKIAGIGVLLLSAVALPALLKLVVPATAALGSGGSGGVGALTGAVASGAKSIGGATGSGGSGAAPAMSGAGGEAGRAGPSGASGANAAGGAAAGGRAAAAAAGPVGAAIAAGASVAQAVGKVAAGAVDGADGDRGHNR